MKNIYKKTKRYASVINTIRKEYGDAVAEEIIQKANSEYWRMKELIGKIPNAHKGHVAQILERAALYSVLRDRFPQDAYHMVCAPVKEQNAKVNQMIAKITKRKWGARFFIWLMYRLGDSVFSEKSGHIKRWKIKEKTCAAFDMLECPYVKYSTIVGVPELAKSFCEDDIDVFDHLPNIKYTRPKTLGLGDEKCEFRMELAIVSK